MEIVITQYAADRMRERLGVPRRSVRRLVERAWCSGLELGFPGPYGIRKICGGVIYCFRKAGNAVHCVTVWRVGEPREERQEAERLKWTSAAAARNHAQKRQRIDRTRRHIREWRRA